MTDKDEAVEATPDVLPRETGSEKSGRDCETCGTELPSVTTVYGSSVVGVCPKCDKGSDQLKAQRAAARSKEAVL
jgi:ribosome-binding protein aMBF1 (putative translation factor)